MKARLQTNAVSGLSNKKAGDVVLSHTISRAVPSAQRGLTTVFGMGTGVTLAAKPPTKFSERVIAGARERVKRISRVPGFSRSRAQIRSGLERSMNRAHCETSVVSEELVLSVLLD